MRRKQQAGAFTLEPLAYRCDLFWCRLLFGKKVVESEHQERVGISQNPFVNRQFVTRLVDALEHGDRVASCFTGNLLEPERGAVKKFQRAGDPLKELRSTPLRRLVRRPQHSADFGHRREAIFHRGGIALGFPRVTPRPVDAQAALAGRVFAGDVVLVVRACRC